MRLALTGAVLVGPLDFIQTRAPSQPAVASATAAARSAPILAAGSPGRAACAGRRDGVPVTVWREDTPSVCPSVDPGETTARAELPAAPGPARIGS